MIHLFICTLFSYQVDSLKADTFILCRLAHDMEEAKSGLDAKNLEIHPVPEWTGHYVSAAQCGDELIKQAAMEISLTTPFPVAQDSVFLQEETKSFLDPSSGLPTPETGLEIQESPLTPSPTHDEHGNPYVAFPTNTKIWG